MSEGPTNAAPRTTEHLRAYKACLACRKRKARCDLGGRDGPPCVRCQRELRECVFPIERSGTKRRRLNEITNEGPAVSTATTITSNADSRVDRQIASVNRGGSSWNRVSYECTDQIRDVDSSAMDDSMAASEAEDLSNLQESEPDLARSVMRTVVSNGNDALNLLFQAAAQDQNDTFASRRGGSTSLESRRGPATATPHAAFLADTSPHGPPIGASTPDVRKLWRNSKFVRMGWVTAEEIIIYLNFFFQHMASLSPVLTDFYADHVNHDQLATEEPLLCCTILMISSRHHTLQGPQAHSRGYFIHRKFWEYCQHLIMKLIYGQEKGSVTKTRTMGTIEALLLLSEWHPRSLHFPPETDGWDSDLILTANDEDGTSQSSSLPNRWLEDVIEPARRSDRMSGMLLGCALSLAYELNVFVDNPPTANGSMEDSLMMARKARARKLLYVFVNQLSSRLGTMSMLPQNLTHLINDRVRSESGMESHWDRFMSAWTELTKLLKSLSDMIFPSESFTQQLLQSGRYVSLLEHFQPLLEQWRGKYLEQEDIPISFRDVLFIEYQYVRIYCNSIGMQAVCERTVAEQCGNTSIFPGHPTSLDAGDQGYIQEVISGSCDMLEKVISLAERDMLRLAPVRVFLRITTASVYLLKAMGIGVRNGQLKHALSVLHRSVHALKSNVVDDMHLANTYPVLLETHIKRLEKGFLASAKRGSSRRSAGNRRVSQHECDQPRPSNGPTPRHNVDETMSSNTPLDWDNLSMNFEGALTENDWLSLPFDPTMAPFGPSGLSGPGLDNDGLHFIWNLPT